MSPAGGGGLRWRARRAGATIEGAMRRRLLALALVGAAATDVAAEGTPLDALLARTDAVAKEVAKVRGLKLKRKVPNDVVDKAELRRRLLAMAAEDKVTHDTAAEGLAQVRWGLIPAGTDYEALLIELLTEQIAGYYDPATKKLTISRSAGDDPEWAELVLAHELDHALQDQAFDLTTFEKLPPAEDDAAAARRALVEGDGIALMIEVMLARTGAGAPWSDPQIALAIEKAMAVPGGGDKLDLAPLAIREALMFPYRAGLAFVASLRRRQPWSAVDAAFKKPPRSTEQVLHPERYLAGDEPVPVTITPPRALAGYQVAHATVWGELGVGVFLRTHGIDAATSALAQEGWGGDRAIVLAPAGERTAARSVGIARLEWDTEADALEAGEALGKAVDRWLAGATLTATPAAPPAGGRLRWVAPDGTVAWLERRDTSMILVVGAPSAAAEALATEVWTVTARGGAGKAKATSKKPTKKPTR